LLIAHLPATIFADHPHTRKLPFWSPRLKRAASVQLSEHTARPRPTECAMLVALAIRPRSHSAAEGTRFPNTLAGETVMVQEHFEG
jgi:hypothetical protein